MPASKDAPEPQWLIQQPEGGCALKTPGRWKSLWATDCARLEEGHQKGEAEVLVFGRKHVVDMKERTVKPLYWKDELPSRAVMRATFFVKAGGGWLPYSENDSELLEDTYRSAKVQLRGQKCEEVEMLLADGENKVVMTRLNVKETVDTQHEDFKVQLRQKRIKAPWKLTATFIQTSFDVCRGTPESGGWGGVLSSNGDVVRESEPPKHVVFVIHGVGESMWSKASTALTSLRFCCDGLRDMSAKFLEDQRRAELQLKSREDSVVQEEYVGNEAKEGETGGGEGTVKEGTEGHCEKARSREGSAEGSVEESAKGSPERDGEGKAHEAINRKGSGRYSRKGRHFSKGGRAKDCGEEGVCAGYVEFLPVEWYNQVHGDDAVSDGLIQDITLPTIPGFREFANQAIMDVMYYLTPEVQASILKCVANELNAMWKEFCRFTPDFKGKVSIVGHSLGSMIAHDILMAQPAWGPTGGEGGTTGPFKEDTAGSSGIPILSFEPEVLLVCGSPIGAFLSLRAATLDKENLFKFKTTKRFFNLFHLYDPVAYRLEPLLDRQLRDLQPEHVPHRGGDRIHVKFKKISGNVGTAITKMSSATGAGLQQLHKNLSVTLNSVTGKMPDRSVEDSGIPSDEVTDARDKMKERIDWVIQESPLEGMNAWASAAFAHSSYFQNMDMVMFLINALDEGLSSETEDDAGVVGSPGHS